MCGIAGFYSNNKIDIAGAIASMKDRMIHRGPDGEGTWMDENGGWTLGHRRLAIQDLSENGAQPMLSPSGRFVMVFNGEIYNAPDIKEGLIKKGLCRDSDFRGTSDTEILLHAFEHMGVDESILASRGMYAIAVFDRREDRMIFVSDPAGEKPLYFGLVRTENMGNVFAFGSDTGALRGFPGFANKPDPEVLSIFLEYNYIPAPYSIYTDIYRLPPGSILEIDTRQIESGIHPGMLKDMLLKGIPVDGDKENTISGIRFKRYWSTLEAVKSGYEDPFTGDFPEAASELENLLKQAVKRQLISDVPLGAFLSGGIDSPLIASLAGECIGKPLRTYTIGFDDEKYDESKYAAEIAAHLGMEHNSLVISDAEMQEFIGDIPRFFTEPLGDPSLIPTYFVSRLAKTGVTVSLSGDAGDELFCGYNTYRKFNALWKKLSRIPLPLRRMCSGGISLLRPLYGNGKLSNRLYRGAYVLGAGDITSVHEAARYRLYSGNMDIMPALKGRHGASLEGDSFNLLTQVFGGVGEAGEFTDTFGSYTALQTLDVVTYMNSDILAKVDRAGMAVSLENRIPMLDRDVMEFAWRLPEDYKYDGVSTKRILRTILYKYVPREMLERPKKGFSVPLKKWLRTGKTKEWAEELIHGGELAASGMLDKKVKCSIWDNFLKNGENELLVWAVLMAEQWRASI